VTVIHIGKRRRKVLIPEVRACQDNALVDPRDDPAAEEPR
jgi:hypothetical protein